MSSSLILIFSITLYFICQSQIIDCDGGQCNCPTTAPTSTPCILRCNRVDICKHETLNCRPNSPCEIQCSAKASCQSGTTVKANLATDVTIICSGEDSCKASTNIECGTGQCKLQCSGGDTACEDFGAIDISNIESGGSFECNGHCPNKAPAPFIATTAAPTSPTKAPTNRPTKIPSKSPTNQPSISPTKFPSDSPSITPTKEPTSDPTITPTNAPTISPTPTLRPTLSPLGSEPTLAPSNADGPSLRPTRNPVNAPTISSTMTVVSEIDTTRTTANEIPSDGDDQDDDDDDDNDQSNDTDDDNHPFTKTQTSSDKESEPASVQSTGTFAAVASSLAVFCCLTSMVLAYIIWNGKRKEKLRLRSESQIKANQQKWPFGLKIGIDSRLSSGDNCTFSPISPCNDCCNTMTGGTFPSSSPSLINGQLHTNNGYNQSCEMTPITHNNLSPTGTAPVYTTPMTLAEPERMDSNGNVIPFKLNTKKSCDSNDSMYQECKIQDHGDHEWNIDTPQGSAETMHFLRNSQSSQPAMPHHYHYTPTHPHHNYNHGFPNTNPHSHTYSPVQWPHTHTHGHSHSHYHHNYIHGQQSHPSNPSWHRMHSHSMASPIHTNGHGHIQLTQGHVSQTPTPDGKKRNMNEQSQSKSSGNSNGPYSPSGVDYNSPLNATGAPIEFRKQTSLSSVYGPGFSHSQNQPQRVQRHSEPPPPPPGPPPANYYQSANANNIGSPIMNRGRNRNLSMPPHILLNNANATSIDENKEDEDKKDEIVKFKFPPKLHHKHKSCPPQKYHCKTDSKSNSNVKPMTAQEMKEYALNLGHERKNSIHSDFTDITKMTHSSKYNTVNSSSGDSSATEIEFELKMSPSEQSLPITPLEDEDDNKESRARPEKPTPVGTMLSPQAPKRFKIAVSPVSLPDIPESEHDAKEEDLERLKDPDFSKTTTDKSLISSSLTETSAIKEYHNNGGFLRLRNRSIENAFDDFEVEEESPIKPGIEFEHDYVD